MNQDLKFFKENLDEMILDSFIYTDFKVNDLREILKTFEGYNYKINEHKNIIYPKNLKQKLIQIITKKKEFNYSYSEEDYLTGECFQDHFLKGKCHFSISENSLDYFTNMNLGPLFNSLLNIKENDFDSNMLPDMFKYLDFIPKSLIIFEYAGFKQTKCFVNYFLEHKKKLDEIKMNYLAWTEITAVGDPGSSELAPVFDKIYDKYDAFNNEDILSKIFMTSSKKKLSNKSFLSQI